MAEDCCATQLIDGNGEFNAAELQNFVNIVKLHQCGLSYAVVAIMGPQSSGKSTLLNHLFRTNFKEMNTFTGRSQTTKGIWIAKAVGIKPFTVVIDLEGTDSRERGEDDATFEKQSALFALAVADIVLINKDDATFEKQSALFALAVADIVLINIWCHDIGREQAASRPLLKTVFQVMMRLFNPRKTTLLFVIRDKTKTPFKILEPILREDIQKIWEMVPKPQTYKGTPLSVFFRVEVVALSSYEEKEKQFKEEVSQLRQKFFHSISPGGLAGDRRGVVPASGFSFSAQQIWKTIKENKDLDLPAHEVMVATVRCEEIANEKFSRLASDNEWMALERAVQSGAVPGFGKRISSILEKYLSEYDMESVYFEEGVRNAKHKHLESKALQLVHPVYISMLGHLRSRALESFKTRLEQSLARGEGFAASVRSCSQSSMLEFDQGCLDAAIQQANWDASKAREKLHRDIEAHASIVQSVKLSELIANYKKQISAALLEPVESLFESGGKDTWASIRKLLTRETNVAVSAFSSAVAGFELDEEIFEELAQSLQEYSRSLVERKAREEAGKVLVRMKDRFFTVFNHDKDSLPRVWTGKEEIREITKEARSESLKLLSTMAAVRLDKKTDKIENVLFSTLMDRTVAPPPQNRGNRVSGDPLASSTWEEVPPEKTLITPMQCKSIWRQFIAETEYTVTQAIAAQNAYKLRNSWLPPPWAIMAMLILGLNEIMFLLRNPLYLLVLFVTYLLGKAIWVQMVIPAEFRIGTLSALTSLSTRFLPAFMNLVRRLATEREGNSEPIHPQRLASQSFRNQIQKSDLITSSIPDTSVSTETGVEYISPQLEHGIVTNHDQEETSCFGTYD